MKILLKCCCKTWEKAHLALGWSREVAAFLKAARDSIFYSDHLHTSFPSAVEQNFDIGSELGDPTRYFWSFPSGVKINQIHWNPIVWTNQWFQWISLEFRWSELRDGPCGIRASCFQSEKHLERLRSDRRGPWGDRAHKNPDFYQISPKKSLRIGSLNNTVDYCNTINTTLLDSCIFLLWHCTGTAWTKRKVIKTIWN